MKDSNGGCSKYRKDNATHAEVNKKVNVDHRSMMEGALWFSCTVSVPKPPV